LYHSDSTYNIWRVKFMSRLPTTSLVLFAQTLAGKSGAFVIGSMKTTLPIMDVMNAVRNNAPTIMAVLLFELTFAPFYYIFLDCGPELTCGARLSHSPEATQYKQKSPWS
jgi:hypothetical protein